MLKKMLNGHTTIVVTIHLLDAEYALFVTKHARECGRPFYIASDEVARLTELVELPIEARTLYKYVKVASHFEEIGDIEENALIIASYNKVIDLLREMRVENVLRSNAAVILSEPEPQVEEAQKYSILINWLIRLDVQSYIIEFQVTTTPIS